MKWRGAGRRVSGDRALDSPDHLLAGRWGRVKGPVPMTHRKLLDGTPGRGLRLPELPGRSRGVSLLSWWRIGRP